MSCLRYVASKSSGFEPGPQFQGRWPNPLCFLPFCHAGLHFPQVFRRTSDRGSCRQGAVLRMLIAVNTVAMTKQCHLPPYH